MSEHVEPRLESEAFKCDRLYVYVVSGRESLSRPFSFDVQLVVTDGEALDLETVIAAEVCLVLSRGEAVVRRVHGIVTEAHRLAELQSGMAAYRIVIEPRITRLSYVFNLEVFVKRSVDDIVTSKLEKFGLAQGTDFEWRLNDALPTQELTIQYRETDLAFVSRLLEHHGLCYYFEHLETHDKLIITDNAAAFTTLGRESVSYRGRGEQMDVYEMAYRRRLVPKNYICRDYSYNNPNLRLQSERVSLAEGDFGGVFDYGLHFQTIDQGNALARKLADRHLADRDVYSGESDLPDFAPGHTWSLTDHPSDNPNLLVVEVTHELTRPARGAATTDAHAYKNHFTAIPGARMYRPPLLTALPRIHGFLHAVVQTDPNGTVSQYAELDAEGRYLVKFRFDYSAAQDGQASSCRLRLMQSSAGPGYGTHFPLRPGVEVLVAFIDGNPDRAIIVGAAPNAVTPSPVGASNSRKSRIRTGSGGLIEIDDGS